MNNFLKITLSFMMLVVSHMGASHGTELFDHPNYSQKDLIKARVAWVGQENRVRELIDEAFSIAQNHVVQYAMNQAGHVATIDANNKTITTTIEGDKQVTLSFDDFSCFLRDTKIIHLANDYMREQLRKPSCPEETAIIERYTENYRSAVSEYDDLMRGLACGRYVDVRDAQQNLISERLMTRSEKKAICHAVQAYESQKYSWDLQWLGKLFVAMNLESYTYFGTGFMKNSIHPLTEKDLAESHLAAMIGKLHAEDYFSPCDSINLTDKQLKKIENNAMHAVIINNYMLPCDNANVCLEERTKQYFEALKDDELSEIMKDYNFKKNRGLDDFNQADLISKRKKIGMSMILHKQPASNFKLYDQMHDRRAEFCKNLWAQIKDETRVQQIARLKQENPVDINSETNRFAGLFDRIVEK